MRWNLKNRPKFSEFHAPSSDEYEKWFEGFERELREHWQTYLKMEKPPETSETWYCLDYLETLVKEILGEE